MHSPSGDTCRTIEAYADESLKKGFPDESKAGKLEWRVANREESEEERFVRDYHRLDRV